MPKEATTEETRTLGKPRTKFQSESNGVVRVTLTNFAPREALDIFNMIRAHNEPIVQAERARYAQTEPVWVGANHPTPPTPIPDLDEIVGVLEDDGAALVANDVVTEEEMRLAERIAANEANAELREAAERVAVQRLANAPARRYG